MLKQKYFIRHAIRNEFLEMGQFQIIGSLSERCDDISDWIPDKACRDLLATSYMGTGMGNMGMSDQ